jgi:uncharacterized coiled-coil protein SlyX
MEDDTIADLKQFIAATVSQNTAEIREDVRRLDKKVDDISDSIAEAIHKTNETTDSKLKNHEHRITRLEKRTA